MFSTAFKTSFRILRREKLYAFINVFGLALAIACALVLGLYLVGELTYDRYLEGHEDIYRVESEIVTDGDSVRWALSPPSLGLLLQHDFPEIVKEVVRMRVVSLSNDLVFRSEDRVFSWSDVYVATPNIFKVFPVEAVYGDPLTALEEPLTMAISETAAKAYFGDRNPLGEILVNDAEVGHKITLVYKDLPENTHIKHDVIFTHNNPAFYIAEDVASLEQALNQFMGYYTFLKIDSERIDVLNKGLETFNDRHRPNLAANSPIQINSWLQPLAAMHYHSNVDGDMPGGNIYYIYAFMAVGIFILLIAIFNYINLSTARSEKRAQEVGMKKILGSGRSNLVKHFLVESLLNSIVAAILAFIIVAIVLDLVPLGNLFGKSISISLLDAPKLIFSALLLSLLIGLVSGLYPALYLSSWAPLNALVTSNKSNSKNLRFRSVLVFVQYLITICIIASTILMINQMSFLFDKNLGFKKENQVIVLLRGFDVISRIPAIKSELLRNTNLLGVSASDTMFGGAMYSGSRQAENSEGKLQSIYAKLMQVEKDFIEVMGLEIIEGRSFAAQESGSFEFNVIVNETFVKQMGWENPIGKRLGQNPGIPVSGVIKDFNYDSLHKPIDPITIFPFPPNETPPNNRQFATRNLVVTISGQNIQDSISSIESTIKRFDPEHSFEFRFLDRSMDQLYQNENRVIGLLTLFAVICIAITCLGLFGLISYMIEQKTRELAIRKILGSSIPQTIKFLSNKIFILLITSSVFASVFSYLAIESWLSNFAYRSTIGITAFILATLLTLFITYFIIFMQSAKIALRDPAQMLKYE